MAGMSPVGGRVALLLDGSNFYRGLQTLTGSGRFPAGALKALCLHLCGARSLARIMYYNSPLHRMEPGHPAQQRFFADLQKIDCLTLRLGKLVRRQIRLYCERCGRMIEDASCAGCGSALRMRRFQDKGTDVNIATDLLVGAFDGRYETAILLSEDSDFIAAVRAVQRLGKRVENAYFRKSHLACTCDAYIPIDPLLISRCRSITSS